VALRPTLSDGLPFSGSSSLSSELYENLRGFRKEIPNPKIEIRKQKKGLEGSAALFAVHHERDEL
jgi:hypothetical protein